MVAAGVHAAGIQQAEYRERRAKLRAMLGEKKGVAVLYGAEEDARGNLRGRFFQEANFYYLTGWSEPGAVLLLTPSEEFLFLPAVDETRVRYTGPKLSPTDAAAAGVTGFDKVLPVARFELTLFEKLGTETKIFSLLTPGQPTPLRGLAGKRAVESIASMLFPMRLVKSAGELALLERSIAVSAQAHRAAFLRAAAGTFEYQVGTAMTAVYFDAGCERNAYAPIVASGPNAITLHYNRNDRRMDSGELLLMDVGAECAMYAADLTRTIPVNGKFTPRQRELYEIVLGAQKAAIAAAKPGMTLAKEGENSLFLVAKNYMDAHGKSVSGEPLGKYFTHGLGHHIGLDVHDPGVPAVPLAAGNVITIEPGLYIPEEGIGIRIEDMVLITENGAKLLSGELVSAPGEIEKILHGRTR